MDIKKYESDIERLISEGQRLFVSMYLDEHPEQMPKDKAEFKKLPNFRDNYQTWYSEALAVVGQLLPSRLDDFISYYSHKGTRKEILYESYTIRDYLDGLVRTRGWEKELIVGTGAGVQKFKQQLEIVKSLKSRFRSSLFDIKVLAQADLFDSELDTASELNKNGYIRAAGAVAGVVLESHLGTIVENHQVKVSKKNPTIADYNDTLKAADVIDVADWRKIQYLGDIRNKCDHKKQTEPTSEEVDELIAGVRKYIKTLL